MRIEDHLVIKAPVHSVWAAIKDPAAHAAWHPFVTRISGEHELGAMRACSVVVGKKAGETRERCVEEEAPRRMIWAIEEDSSGFGRMVSDWRSGFTVEDHPAGALVRAESWFAPKNLLVRLMAPLIRRKFHQAQVAILGGLQQAVEDPQEPEEVGAKPSRHVA